MLVPKTLTKSSTGNTEGHLLYSAYQSEEEISILLSIILPLLK